MGEQRLRHMTLHQFRLRPKWQERASEIKEIEEIDRQIAELRRRRQMMFNRIHPRTEVWTAHHSDRKRA
jgi:hypothetical protein